MLYPFQGDDRTVRPFVAVFAGYEDLSWTTTFSIFGGGSSGDITLLYVAPEAGLDISVSESARITFGGRYKKTVRQDREDIFGGDTWEVYAGMSFVL